MKNGKKQILIADDDKEIRDILKILLTGEGYEVQAVENGRQALEAATALVDLYILDVNMPEMSGFFAAAEIRRQFETPILFLTAYSSESDKVMGFSAGADDYVVKPFSNVELILRVRALLRRGERSGGGAISSGGAERASSSGEVPEQRDSATGSEHQLPLGDLVLDLDRQSVIRDGQPVALTYTEYKILELLVTHRKKIYSLENIYQSVWEEEPVGDGAIMVHIKNIRKKLGDDSRNPRYIKTAWGKGYYVD